MLRLPYFEALRIAQKVDYREGMVNFTGNVAALALDRRERDEAQFFSNNRS